MLDPRPQSAQDRFAAPGAASPRRSARPSTNGSSGLHCAVCGSSALEPHLRVGADLAADDLIPTTDRYGTALADIVRCRSCGHRQLETIPAEAELLLGYEQAASMHYVDEEAGQRATARGTLDWIERYVPPGRLLDLGCWLGFLLDEARARGWEPLGVEPSSFASEFARERLGVPVITAGLLEAELPEGRFDAIVLGDVIEHLPWPREALARIHSLLAPGGVLAIMTPDAGSRVARLLGKRWWSVLPTHVHYFTRHSLRTALEGEGYELLEVATAAKTFSTSYYVGRLGGYSRGVERVLSAALEAVRLDQRMVTPDLHDRMIAIARAAG